MKRILARELSWEFVLLLLFGLFSTVAATWISHFNHPTALWQLSPAQARMNTLENMLKIPSSTLNTPIPYSMIYERLTKTCTAESIDQARSQLKVIAQYATPAITAAESDLNNNARKFRSVRDMIINVSSADHASFCRQKYLTYSLLELVQWWSNPRVSPYSSWTTIAVSDEADNPIGDEQEEIHGAAPIGADAIALVHDLVDLDEDAAVYVDMTEYTINQITDKMIDQWFLTQDDISNLNNSIELHYINRCGTSHGSFHMIQATWWDLIFKKLRLEINLCSNPSYVYNYQNYVTQLFIHELGHYLYYFKDHTTAQFNQICWEGTTKICDETQFVTKYASSNNDEDYAESFAYRYITHQNKPIDSPLDTSDFSRLSRLGRRAEYFDNSFEDLLFPHD